jgi:predicted small secreted protein
MKTITTLIAAVVVLALAGCNTMAGIGKDVQKAGSAVENAAKK